MSGKIVRNYENSFCALDKFYNKLSGHEHNYRGADKSLARPGRKQARKHVRDARDFNNIEMRDVINFFFLQGKAPKETYPILTETLACFLPGLAEDLSTPLRINLKCSKMEYCRM